MSPHHAPVSHEQALMLRRMNQSPYPTAYITAVRITLTGQVDPAALHRSLDALAVRHHALRTRFVPAAPAGEWTQAVDAPRPVHHEQHDFTGRDPDDRHQGIRALVDAFIGRPFDIAGGHLLRTALVRTGHDRWELLLAYHHLIVDGWSLRILLEDLSALYGAESGGPAPAPAAVQLQPADHARAQRTDTAPERHATGLAHWLDLLGDRPQLLGLPADFARPATFMGRGADHAFSLGPALHTAVRRLAGQCGVTPFVVLASAVGALMSRLTGQHDIVLSVPFFNRTAAYERVVTCMAGPLFLLCEIRPDDTFTDLVERTGDHFFDALEHHHVPATDLLDALVAERGWSRQDPPTVAVAMQNYGLDDALKMPGITARTHLESLHIAYTDLVFNMLDTGDSLDGIAIYRSELLRADTVAGWTRDLAALLTELVDDPAAPLAAAGSVRG
ncbi:condensation domain-containing protein [Streptomyces sp. NPDC050264]|uniref:condensation domain-containing protein n=1 Tax=Streptomyces sp. NPDC050264 TaxID=3155038 RepID=UPI003421B179